MDIIKVKCITNLDDYDCTIVRYLSCRPMVGDFVQVLYKGGVESRL